MIQSTFRAGVAMIELIFAIVIMGIVLMSAPLLISQAEKGAIVGVQQEAISAAASNIGMILTRHWDEQDTDETRESPILSTGSVVAALSEATAADGNLSGRRVGTPTLSYRSFLTSTGERLAATTPANFTTENDFDDIDDYDGVTTTISLPNAGDATNTQTGDYTDTSLQMATAVRYISDAPTAGTFNSSSISFSNPGAAVAGTSNIKFVSTTITSAANAATLGTNVTLSAFTCNIGTYKLEERTF